MAKTYYDNSDPGQRLQPGTTAEGEAVDLKFDQVATGLGEVEQDTRRSLKFPYEAGMASQEFVASALERRNRVLGFDTNGQLELVSGFYYRQDWQPEVTYYLNDVVRDPATTNLYVCIRRHVSGTTSDFADTATWYLAVDADTVRTERLAAEAARDLSEQYRDTARQWASQDPGPVGGTAYQSAKTYALQASADEQATRAYRDEVDAAEGRVEILEQSTQANADSASSSAAAASTSETAAAQSAASVEGLETEAQASADAAAGSATEAASSETEVKSIETRILDTTTMDFLNFELSGPDLIAHFDGYGDDSKFSINAAGELEVIL